jgi:hypothetical protein
MTARACAAVVATWSSVALASPSHRELGAEHYAKGEYAAAASEFRQCITIEQQPDCSFALAQTLRVLGDCGGAVRSYTDFLASHPAEAEARAARDAITACGGTYDPEPVQPQAPPAEVPERPEVRPRHDAWYHDHIAVAALVAGGVASIAGGTCLWLSARAHDEAVQAGSGSGTLDEFEGHLDDAQRLRWIGAVSLGVGGALLVAATVKLLATDRDATTAPSASVFTTGDGIMVSGRLAF